MAQALQTIPLLPAQDELKEIDYGLEKLDQVIQSAKERRKNEEPLLDEIEHINELS